mmetsp:Transcript_5505/g.10913  ORF Transcript_5505/g.10913 Transcript_5505/m.10913 type:complete len:83 (+) Transcript_5505:2295-2543(+)
MVRAGYRLIDRVFLCEAELAPLIEVSAYTRGVVCVCLHSINATFQRGEVNTARKGGHTEFTYAHTYTHTHKRRERERERMLI